MPMEQCPQNNQLIILRVEGKFSKEILEAKSYFYTHEKE